MVRAPIEPRRVIYGQARVSGAIVYVRSHGADNAELVLVLALAGHRIQDVTAVWLNDDPVLPHEIEFGNFIAGGWVVGGKFANNVYLRAYRGDQTTVDPYLQSASGGEWDASHVGQDVAYLVVGLIYNRDLFANGIPNITVLVTGNSEIYDPRSGTTGYSNNWALCVRDYLTKPYGMACTADEIDEPYFVAAANLSDEAVPLNADGSITQARYTADGNFTLDRTPTDIMGELLVAGGGALVYVQGRYRLHGGAYVTPTAILTESDFAGPVELVTKPPRRELFNSVRGSFINPGAFWQPAEFPAVSDANAVAADGETIWRDLELPWIIDPTRAQRLARQLLRRARQSLTLRAPLRYEHIQLSVWQTVAVSLADFGWTLKPFRVTAWTFDPSSGVVTVTLQEEQVNSYAWLYDEADNVPEVPDTTLVNPLDIPAVVGVTLTAATDMLPDGTVVPSLLITWQATPHPFVTAYEVQWRELPDGDWNSVEVPSDARRYMLAPVKVGIGYDVRVRAIAGLVRGAWSSTSNGQGAADTTPPGPPIGLAAQGIVQGISVTWTLPSDLDLAAVEVYENTSDDAGSRYYVGESPGSGFLRTGITYNSERWYWVRARDRSGNHSGFVGPVSAASQQIGRFDLVDDIATIEIISSLDEVWPDGTVAVLETDHALYQRVNGQWLPMVNALGPNGTLTSDQIESLEAAKLAGQITETQIGDEAVTTPKLAAGAVETPNLAAGAVTTEKLSVGPAGGNVIWNSCCAFNRAGWIIGGTVSPAAWGAVGTDLADATWRALGIGTGGFTVTGVLPAGQYSDMLWAGETGEYTPVRPGEWWEWQALIQAHRCNLAMVVAWYDWSHTFLSETAVATTGAVQSPAGNVLEAYTQLWGKAQAPAGAAFAVPFFRMWGHNLGADPSDTDPYIFFTRAQFAPASASQVEPKPWSPGGVTEISGGMIRTQSITANHLLASQIFGDQGVFNALTAGIGQFGGLTANELRANEVLITQTLQLGDQIVTTGKIGTGQVSTGSWWTGTPNGYHTRPGGGWVHTVLTSVGVTADGEARMLVHTRFPGLFLDENPPSWMD